MQPAIQQLREMIESTARKTYAECHNIMAIFVLFSVYLEN